MKKFTKICLIIVAVILVVGFLFCGIATLMGTGYGTIRQMARNGELNVGNWKIGETSIVYQDDWDFYDEDDDWEYDTEDSSVDSSTLAVAGTFEASKVENLSLDIEAATIVIGESDTTDQIQVVLRNVKEKYYSCELDGDTLKMKYDTNHHYNNYSSNHSPQITILLPAGVEFDEVDLDIGAAEMIINEPVISCNILTLDVGAGTLESKGFDVAKDTVINIGAGTVEIEDGTYHNVSLESGMGTLEFKGIVEGDITGDCGMGSIEIELEGTESEYNYNLSCGMGSLVMNGRNLVEFGGEYVETNQGAVGTISLDCGMGSVELTIH